MTSSVCLVLTTLGASHDAAALARTLVGERLAACVNIVPAVTSVYRWQGAVDVDAEQQLVIKTTREQVPALEARLHELHPYDLPECLVLPVLGGSLAYLEWVGASVGEEE
jgi:periplasmic divalent cation tolerance protein